MRGDVARFFAKLAAGGGFGELARFEGASGDFQQEAAGRVAVLPHQHEFLRRGHGDDRHRAGMADDLAGHDRAEFTRTQRFLGAVHLDAKEASLKRDLPLDQPGPNIPNRIRHQPAVYGGSAWENVTHGGVVQDMRARVSLLTGLILFPAALADGQPREPDAEAVALEREGHRRLHNYDFEEAAAVFERLESRFPDSVAGPYGRAVVLWMQGAQQVGAMRGSSHRTDRSWGQGEPSLADTENAAMFADLVGRVRERTEQTHARDPGNLLNLYYLGAAEALQAGWEMTVVRSHASGMRAMGRAVGHHRSVLEADPDFADAYHVPGAYEYGVATLPRALRMIASMFGARGERDRALDWITRAALEGERFRWSALWTMAHYMQREHRLAEALTAIRTLREQFPRNPDYALEEMGVLLHHGSPAEARAKALEFLERRDAGFGNFHLAPGGLAELRLGESWLFEERWEEAETAFSEGLQSSPPPDIRAILHFRRGNARDGLGQRQRARFDYNRVRQLGGDEVVEDWAQELLKTPWPEGAPEDSRPHVAGEPSRPH